MLMAVLFFAALWFDPAQPARASALGYGLLGGYLALALVLLAVALRSWWWDHRLAWPVLGIDVVAFLWAVFFTESLNDDFTSPFLAFFTFLMLAVTIRWDWRMTAATGVVVTVLYFVVGLGLTANELDINLLRFGRRVAYMFVLSLLLIWFGLQRREQQIGAFSETSAPAESLPVPLEGALHYAIEQTGARAGAIAWSNGEEPSIELRTAGLHSSARRLAPGDLSEDRAFGAKVRLFSADRQRSLKASSGSRPEASGKRVSEPLADLLGVGEALAVPFSGGAGRGEILLVGINGVGADHVVIGQLVAREVRAALDRHATLVLSHESALARTRYALARDLHDNVAQSLAGAALRLEGLRTSIRAGNDPDAEIVELKAALRAEQKQVRELIDRLRYGEPELDTAELSASVLPLVNELSRAWNVAIALDCPHPLAGPAELRHEIASILREAVANAVRHGEARKMTVAFRRADNKLRLTISDDGTGFPSGAGRDAPRSIRERVSRQGGFLALDTERAGTKLEIQLPMGDEA
ncbi:two-component sensor histidine kinase [Tsuneonella deserti]|uniref:histidine kinase n=1 Tax=Tsuneonella deserti TaxID=2035528 RepID=A0ABQ1S9B8_9SPHN|nr:two-component sensor histidine kinase [Tsuneonella deserti]